jgi:hypothetical protein
MSRSRPSVSRRKQVLLLRSAALALVEHHGRWERLNVGLVRTADHGRFTVLYTTPFQRTPEPTEDVREFYHDRAIDELLAGGRHEADAPMQSRYMLEVWASLAASQTNARRSRPHKVLHLEWNGIGATVGVGTFRRGSWESELLSVAEDDRPS